MDEDRLQQYGLYILFIALAFLIYTMSQLPPCESCSDGKCNVGK